MQGKAEIAVEKTLAEEKQNVTFPRMILNIISSDQANQAPACENRPSQLSQRQASLRRWGLTAGRAVCLSGILLGFCGAAQAANLCVGPTATGNGSGSDWNNLKAWNDTPARGDTWYLAAGAYTGKTFNAPTSGTTLITIKKATPSDHGSGTGWSDTIGTGQATFSSQIQFDSSYWVFDGQTGGGLGSWSSNYGIKVTSTDDSLANIRIGYSGLANNITVRHVALFGKGSASNQGGYYSNQGIAIYGCSNITVSYAWIHGAGNSPFFIDSVNSVFEYIYSDSYYGTSSNHSEIASIWRFAGLNMGDITFRYSMFTHVISTGGLMFDNSSNPNCHMYVYGNVFYKPSGDTWEQANGVIGGWTGGGGEEMHNVWLYNNTFVNVDQLTLSNLPNIYSGCQAINNVWYNCNAPVFTKFPTHDYNLFINSGDAQGEAHGVSVSSSDPFVNSAGLDFRLKANTALGQNLGSPYNTDATGLPRTTWTRGAYEYGTAASGTPAAPQNLHMLAP